MMVTSVKQVLTEAFDAIKNGRVNDGCRIILANVKDDVLRYLSFIHWDAEEATLILDDALLIICDKIKKEEIKELTVSYIKKVCRNLGANRYRQATRNKQKYVEYRAEKVQELQNDLSEHYGFDLHLFDEDDPHSSKNEAIRAYAMLSERCQQMIRLKYVDDASHEEIAKTVDGIKNKNSSRSQVDHCKKRWRQLIEKLKFTRNMY